MKRLFLLLIFLGGCDWHQTPESSVLPWNKPAPWELRRDISTSTSFHREYKPDDLSGPNSIRNRKRLGGDVNKAEVKVNFDEAQARLNVMQGVDRSEGMRSRIIHNRNEFPSSNAVEFPAESIQTYPQENRPYDFSEKK
jgi:hypothetical protein